MESPGTAGAQKRVFSATCTRGASHTKGGAGVLEEKVGRCSNPGGSCLLEDEAGDGLGYLIFELVLQLFLIISRSHGSMSLGWYSFSLDGKCIFSLRFNSHAWFLGVPLVCLLALFQRLFPLQVKFINSLKQLVLNVHLHSPWMVKTKYR